MTTLMQSMECAAALSTKEERLSAMEVELETARLEVAHLRETLNAVAVLADGLVACAATGRAMSPRRLAHAGALISETAREALEAA
jgi:hypothetical protein